MRAIPHWLRRWSAVVGISTLAALGLATTAQAADGDPDTTVTITAATAADGLVVDIAGTGYTDLPTPTATPAPAGVYAAIYDAATATIDDINNDPRGVPLAVTMLASGDSDRATLRDGTWSTTLTVPSADVTATSDLQVLVWVAHGFATDDTIVYHEPLALTDDQRAALLADDSAPAEATDDTATPTDEVTAISAPVEPELQCRIETIPATAGSIGLTWGVKSSFVTYLENMLDDGAVTATGGAARSGNAFTWGTGSGSLDADATSTVSFPGAVTFSGHGGVLNTTLSHPRVTINADGSGSLVVDATSTDPEGNDISGSNVTFATLSFSSHNANGGAASATLTAEGAAVLAGFYDAGEALDPVTVAVSGAAPARDVERCYDADGNLVTEDGTPVGQMAATGINTTGMASLAVLLLGVGLVLLAGSRRRAGRHHA